MYNYALQGNGIHGNILNIRPS